MKTGLEIYDTVSKFKVLLDSCHEPWSKDSPVVDSVNGLKI